MKTAGQEADERKHRNPVRKIVFGEFFYGKINAIRRTF